MIKRLKINRFFYQHKIIPKGYQIIKLPKPQMAQWPY